MRRFYNYSSGQIQYNDNGKGPVIVLLHGYFETSASWGDFATKLARDFRVITVDLPGHGGSDIFADTHSMEFMAKVVREIILSLNIKKIFLAGHSMGGYVTIAFVGLFPGMLSGYCLFHSHPFADTPEVLEKRDNEIKLALSGRKDIIYPATVKKMYAPENLDKLRDSFEISKQIASTISAEGIVAALRGMKSRPSRLAVMEKGEVPCLWILGTMDNFVNYEQVTAKVRLPENAELAVLQNSGHLGFIEEENRCLEIFRDFIKRRVLNSRSSSF